jgi:LPXTG-site transpeptidase (sortase) family protein
MSRNNNWKKILGNAFIALSFFGFVFIYYPVIRGYFFPPTILIPDGVAKIEIPKINASAPIIFNVDPWNKEEYLNALANGVAHAKNTDTPEGTGTMYLFAHSSDAPWRITKYNTIFLRLNELEAGDEIIITMEKIPYHYRVREKKTAWPNEVTYLTDPNNLKQKQLILQTCWPIGTDLKRLLVFAEPVI